MTKYAVATLIMLGDKYVPGAIVLGHSLKTVLSPAIDKIVMVHGVSTTAKNALKKLWKVVEVPLWKFESNPFLCNTPEQKKRYDVWISSSYTKWQLLSLTQYKKILFLDADTIVLRKIDDIFEVETPAGVFVNVWMNRLYRHIKYGNKIPSEEINKAFEQSSAVLVGSAVLLSPNANDHIGLLDLIMSNLPFGYKIHSGNDEQSLVLYYKKKNVQWTSLPPTFNNIPWKSDIINPSKCIVDPTDEKDNLSTIFTSTTPYVVHYFGIENIWDMDPYDPKAWDDIYPWWTLAINYIRSRPKKEQKYLLSIFKLDRLDPLPSKCYWCKFLGIDSDHAIFDSDSNVVCPIISH